VTKQTRELLNIANELHRLASLLRTFGPTRLREARDMRQELTAIEGKAIPKEKTEM